jgi:hypothetical protein
MYVWYIGEAMHPLNTIYKVLNLKQNAFIIVIIIQMLFHVINYVLKRSVREDNSLITHTLKWMHFEYYAKLYIMTEPLLLYLHLQH